MNAAQYWRAQMTALFPLLRLLRAVLHALGVPVTSDQVDEVALRLYRPVLTARDRNYVTARRFLAAADLPSGLVVPGMRDYPLTALTGALTRVSSELRVEGDPVSDANRGDARVIEMARKAAEGPVTRQALEPARETVQRVGEDEDHTSVGWARQLVGASSCSFCAVLCSRGPIYSSRETAIGRGGSPADAYHTAYLNKNGKLVGGNCDCIAVPIIKGRHWEGRKAYERLEELWQTSTDGFSGGDAMNAFRREWDKKVRDGETHKYLADSFQSKPQAA